MKPADANPDVSVGIDSFNPLLMLQWIRKKYFTVFKTAAHMVVLLAAVLLLVAPTIPAGATEHDLAPSNIIAESTQITGEAAGLPTLDIRVIIARIIRVVLGLIGIILVVLIIYGGYIYMTAGGNEEQISKAKAILKNAMIGLAIVLAAYSIVLFVMRMLGLKFNEGGAGLNPPGTVNFVGSGALGRIIKDHYPMRDDINVPRNTKIVVTFRRPIKIEDLVEDVSNNGQPDGIFGNCIVTSSFNWLSHCDRVKKVEVDGVRKLSDSFISIKRFNGAAQEPITDAVIMAEPSPANGTLPSGVYTIVLKPITNLNDTDTGGGYLGSATEDVKYSVRLGGEIRLDDPANNNPKALTPATVGNNYYEWQFTCNTNLDLSPPTVTRVYPSGAAGKIAPKNSVIQIDFSEPIDPTGVQGGFAASGTYFKLPGDNIFLNTPNSTRPEGNFVLTNGYRTLEFTPTKDCGVVNACGGKMYCLPVCDKPGASCSQDSYELLLRAGRVLAPGNFAAMPFTGVMDMVGNALDGDSDRAVDSAHNTGEGFVASGASQWEQPDNYFWKFNIENKIDASSPYLIDVYPGLDAGYVPAREPLTMLFSKLMRVDPMYGIEIKENPAQTVPIWKVPRVLSDAASERTAVNMLHGLFLDGKKQDYLPVVTSAVEDVNFNCFYPGKGPNENLAETGRLNSADCQADGTNCCAVTSSTNSAFCCNGTVRTSENGVSSCFNELIRQ